MNARLKIIGFLLFCGFVSVLARLGYWQLVKASELSQQAQNQHVSGEILSARRGKILAQDGSVLAGVKDSWLLYAYLPDIEEKVDKIADLLAPFTFSEELVDVPDPLFYEASRIKKLFDTDSSWVAIRRKLDTDSKKDIESLGVKGLGFDLHETRAYPESSAAAHLLGFLGKNDVGEDNGYFGIEGYYDLVLSGKPGFISQERDARGVPIIAGNVNEVSAVGGADLVTSIDKTVQIILDKKLAEGIEKYGAKSGSAIVVDPKTGDVLGLSAYPSFDPDEYYKYPGEFYTNPIVSSTFEPGSIFKVVVMAAGLDARVVEPDTVCDICAGPFKIDKYFINTWNNEYNPDATMTDTLVHSDNVGMVFVGKRLGADKLYDYLANFGFGELTEIDLQGEAALPLREKGTWSDLDVATTTFGQGIAVTPIQMVRAVSAIANDGKIPKLSVVERILGEGWERAIPKDEPKAILSKEAADEITAMMVEAAKNGESKWTYLKGFDVAGKTGTAQIPIAGHYDDEKTIASFVGFAPSTDPKYLMLVTLSEPQSSPWASETAAPLWYSISQDLFLHFGIRPDN